jgi:hypothetical protein
VQAMRVRRIGAPPSKDRLYLDSKRVDRATWDAAHFGRVTDAHLTTIERRKGVEVVREYHSIRVRDWRDHA